MLCQFLDILTHQGFPACKQDKRDTHLCEVINESKPFGGVLGSLYGNLTGIALTILLMARILWEEAMLTRDLEGYREYMNNVRYRLFPFLW